MAGSGAPGKVKFHLGEGEWEKLRNELSRIAEGRDAVLLLSIALASPSVEEAEEEEEGEEEVHVENQFTRSVKALVRRIRDKYGASPHLHLHRSSGSVLLALVSPGELVTDNLRSIINEVTSCEGCLLARVEGEVRVGEDVSALFHGSSGRMQFILPAADGKSLRIMDLLLTL